MHAKQTLDQNSDSGARLRAGPNARILLNQLVVCGTRTEDAV
jgi:hypothetical protein